MLMYANVVLCCYFPIGTSRYTNIRKPLAIVKASNIDKHDGLWLLHWSRVHFISCGDDTTAPLYKGSYNLRYIIV